MSRAAGGEIRAEEEEEKEREGVKYLDVVSPDTESNRISGGADEAADWERVTRAAMLIIRHRMSLSGETGA
jgi:hypothetical protein